MILKSLLAENCGVSKTSLSLYFAHWHTQECSLSQVHERGSESIQLTDSPILFVAAEAGEQNADIHQGLLVVSF